MISGRHQTTILMLAAIVAAGLSMPSASYGQRGRGGPGPAAARSSAPADLTGYWVAVVSEDWKFRMVTPPKGQTGNIPLSPEGRKVAETWDPARDAAAGEQCRAYGAAGIMRIPTRLNITWENDNVLRIDAEAGTQTRLLRFDKSQPPAAPAWQGYSVAQWQGAGARGGGDPGGSLKVVTTHMRPGYLRKNGVPYGSNAIMTEYFESHAAPNGDRILVVTAIIEDPQNLNSPYVTSTNFKKLTGNPAWNPTPCSAD